MEKAGEAKEHEKVGNLEGKIWKEKKPPDETVFSANKEKGARPRSARRTAHNVTSSCPARSMLLLPCPCPFSCSGPYSGRLQWQRWCFGREATGYYSWYWHGGPVC